MSCKEFNFYNSDDKKRDRVAFARENSYDNHLNRIFSIIKEKNLQGA